MNNKEVIKKHDEMDESIRKIMKDNHPDKGYPLEKLKNVAIGYLDITEPQYEVGEVPSGFVEKVKYLLKSGLVIGSLGFHECEFCLNQGVKKLPRDALSSSEKTVVDKENNINYMFPEMLPHYVTVHMFKPPQEFIEFVMTK